MVTTYLEGYIFRLACPVLNRLDFVCIIADDLQSFSFIEFVFTQEYRCPTVGTGNLLKLAPPTSRLPGDDIDRA